MPDPESTQGSLQVAINQVVILVRYNNGHCQLDCGGADKATAIAILDGVLRSLVQAEPSLKIVRQEPCPDCGTTTDQHRERCHLAQNPHSS